MTEGQTYGRWLRQKRGTKGSPGFISQQRLADEVGVDRTHIVQIENGRIGTPDFALRDRIHEVFGTTDDDLRDAGVIVLGAHDNARRWARDQAAREPSQPSQSSQPDDPLAALVATFTPRQRRMLVDLLDRANARALEHEAQDEDDAGERKPRRSEP